VLPWTSRLFARQAHVISGDDSESNLRRQPCRLASLQVLPTARESQCVGHLTSSMLPSATGTSHHETSHDYNNHLGGQQAATVRYSAVQNHTYHRDNMGDMPVVPQQLDTQLSSAAFNVAALLFIDATRQMTEYHSGQYSSAFSHERPTNPSRHPGGTEFI
jgi:hypothetical protein